MSLLDFLNPVKPITDALVKAYVARETSRNDAERIKAEVDIAALEARRDAVISATINDKWWSPRTLMGYSAAIYVFKLIVWDTVLGLGVTRNPGEHVIFIITTIIGFYFVSKGAEVVANTIAGALARKYGAGK